MKDFFKRNEQIIAAIIIIVVAMFIIFFKFGMPFLCDIDTGVPYGGP